MNSEPGKHKTPRQFRKPLKEDLYKIHGIRIDRSVYGFKKPKPAKSTKQNRNDPCACGSGKKYKKCCL